MVLPSDIDLLILQNSASPVHGKQAKNRIDRIYKIYLYKYTANVPLTSDSSGPGLRRNRLRPESNKPLETLDPGLRWDDGKKTGPVHVSNTTGLVVSR